MGRYYVAYVPTTEVRKVFREEGFGHVLPRMPPSYLTCGLCFLPDGEGKFVPHHVTERGDGDNTLYRLPVSCAAMLVNARELRRLLVELQSWERRMADLVTDDDPHGPDCPILGRFCPIMQKG